jgi:hypothetical protein
MLITTHKHIFYSLLHWLRGCTLYQGATTTLRIRIDKNGKRLSQTFRMNELLLSGFKCITIENATWLQILVHLTHSVEWMQFYRMFA